VSNGSDNNLVDDKELDKYLSGSSEYSRRYRAVESDSVPPELDRLVLTEASASAGHLPSIVPKRSRSLGFWMRASTPVALAASVVLVVSVVIRSGIQSERLETQIALESAAPPPKVELPATAEETVAYATEVEKPVLAPAIEMDAPAPAAPAIKARSSQAAPPAEQAALDEVIVQGRLVRSTPEDTALPVEVFSSEDLRQQDGTAQKSAANGEAQRRQEQSTATGLEEVIVTGQLRREPAGAGPRGTVRPTSGPSATEIAKQEREADPEAWLRHIRELRTEGKQREADREWRDFMKAYPNYRVDEADTARSR
jgi:hypothetical protein